MLMSLLGTSLINAGLGGGNFKDAISNIGLGFAGNLGTAIPALFGSMGQSGKRMPSYNSTGLGRSLLENNKRMATIDLAKKQRDIIKKARTAQGTISAYLAGRGFARGGSTEMLLANQNLNNAMEDIEMAGLETRQKIFDAQVKQLQSDYSMMNTFEASYIPYENPMWKFVKESFVQPTISKNLSSIGKQVSASINNSFQERPKQPQETQSTGSFVQPLISKSWIK